MERSLGCVLAGFPSPQDTGCEQPAKHCQPRATALLQVQTTLAELFSYLIFLELEIQIFFSKY